MRKYMAMVIISTSLFLLPGCVDTSMYHQFDDKAWLTEQVEKGVITQEQADQLWSQLQQEANKE